jgi:hypothetical protein
MKEKEYEKIYGPGFPAFHKNGAGALPRGRG